MGDVVPITSRNAYTARVGTVTVEAQRGKGVVVLSVASHEAYLTAPGTRDLLDHLGNALRHAEQHDPAA